MPYNLVLDVGLSAVEKSKDKEIKLKENFGEKIIKLGFRRRTKFIMTKGRRKSNTT